MYFGDKRNAGIIQYSTKLVVVSYFQQINKKTITTDTAIYYTGSYFLKTSMFY